MQKEDLNECIQIINNLTKNYGIEVNLDMSRYKMISTNESILNNPTFRNDLYNSLRNLLNFYNENNYFEEKYMMLLINLIFGINSHSNNPVSIKQKKRNTTIPVINLGKDSYINYYRDQNDKIVELSYIILNTILLIDDNINDLNNEDEGDEVENYFNSEVNEYFLKHFCLFSETIHKLINTLYYEMEYNVNEYKDYVLFMEILIENKENFRPLLISKFNRTLEQYSKDEIDLLSLGENVDFSDEFDLIKINQRLKALNYLKEQKFYNNSIINYDNVKYINKHFLSSKIKISKEKFEKIYKFNGNNNIICKGLKNKQIINDEIIHLNDAINILTLNYQRDISILKDSINKTQNHFNTNVKLLKDKLTNLQLQIEKLV